MVLRLLPATLLLISSVRAATNDWSVPCHNGSCSYDVTNGTAGASLLISGHPNAISDLTPAAGWTILDCTPDGMAQDVRIVCTGDNSTCSHIDNGGANNTIVRLPDSCSQMPFARVARDWIHSNQTLPSDITTNLTKRGITPVVRGITLDTNFAAVDPSQNGNVTLLIAGSTQPGNNGNFTVTNPTRRGFFSSIGDDIEHAASDVEGDVEAAASDVESAATTVANDVENALGDAKNIVQDHLSSLAFNKEAQGSKTLDFDKSGVLFDVSTLCAGTNGTPAVKGEISVSMDAKGHIDLDYGVVAVGSIVPPKIDDFGIFANLDASLNGTLSVNATATAIFSTPKLSLFELGIPGLTFPGILSIGPTLEINALGLATIDTEIGASIGINYKVDGAKVFYPASAGNSSGTYGPADSYLDLSAVPNVRSDLSVTAHLIPEISFGIDALDGTAKATVHLELDTSAGITFSLTDSETITAAGSDNSGFDGCVDVFTKFEVVAVADSGFFGIFDQTVKVPFFDTQYDLFKKCLGTSSGSTGEKRAVTVPSRRHSRDILTKRGLTCPANPFSLRNIIGDTIVANIIKAAAE